MNFKKIFFAAVFLIIAAAVVIVLLPSATAPLHWEQNTGQMYKIYIRTVMFASQPSIKSIHRSFELKGILNFRIYDTDKDSIKAGFQLSNLAIRRGSIEDKAAEKLYSNLFFADFSREGKLTNFRFSNVIAADDERIISDIIQSFQLIVKDATFGKWTTEEKNINGTYKAKYSAKQGIISKSKKEYIAVTDIKGKSAGDTIEVKDSGIKFEYGRPYSWIKSAEGSELIVFYSDDQPYLKVSSASKLTAIDFNPDKSLAIWNDSESDKEIITKWEKLPKNTVSLGEKSETNALKHKFGEKTLDEIAGELFGKYKEFDIRCIQTLLEFLELHPDAALQFPDYLRKKKLNPTQQIMLVHALERNGSEKSQQSLSGIMLGTDFSKESRTQAAIAFGTIGKPSQESIRNLWEAYNAAGRKDDKYAGTVSSTAVLALGAMAKNLGLSTEENYTDRSESIKKRISEDLEAKKNLNTTVALLHAAGNTADGKMINNITPYFRDNNPRVRSAAVTSLTYMDDGEVNNILTRELNTETDINVRDSIINTMYRKEATQETVSAVIEKIQSEDNDIVRGSMYRYLLKNRDLPGVKDAMAKMLKNETSAEHRKIISRALHTKKPASAKNDN